MTDIRFTEHILLLLPIKQLINREIFIVFWIQRCAELLGTCDLCHLESSPCVYDLHALSFHQSGRKNWRVESRFWLGIALNILFWMFVHRIFTESSTCLLRFSIFHQQNVYCTVNCIVILESTLIEPAYYVIFNIVRGSTYPYHIPLVTDCNAT